MPLTAGARLGPYEILSAEPELARRHSRQPVVSVSSQAVSGLAAERAHTPHNTSI
jgi:hypothetical protein